MHGFLLALLVVSVAAFVPATPRVAHRRSALSMSTEIAPGVSFDTVAREWRCKWSGDNDKASLAAAQKELDGILATVKGVAGVKGVQRVVCGGCLDFKVITSLDGESFGKWEEAGFAPEAVS